MIVVDASVIVAALVDVTPPAEGALQILAREDVHVPELLDLEVVSALRGRVLGRRLSTQRASRAVDDLERLPAVRHRHTGLSHRVWTLRHNLTPYDAVYVALAELLDGPLVTFDARLARAPGIRCRVDLLD